MINTILNLAFVIILMILYMTGFKEIRSINKQNQLLKRQNEILRQQNKSVFQIADENNQLLREVLKWKK